MTLAEGLETVARRPRRCCASARRAARPWRCVEARRVMRAVVVALGKIGLPLAAQIARAGHEVVGCDIDAARRRARQRRASRRSPARPGSTEALAEVVGDGRLRAHDRHGRGGRRGRRPRRRRAAAGRRRRRAAGLGRRSTRSSPTSARGLQRGRRRWRVETTLPVGTTRDAHRARRSRATAACARRTTSSASSAPSASTAAASSRDLATYPKLVGGLSAAGEARGVELYRSVPRRRGLADGLAPRPPS